MTHQYYQLLSGRNTTTAKCQIISLVLVLYVLVTCDAFTLTRSPNIKYVKPVTEWSTDPAQPCAWYYESSNTHPGLAYYRDAISDTTPLLLSNLNNDSAAMFDSIVSKYGALIGVDAILTALKYYYFVPEEYTAGVRIGEMSVWICNGIEYHNFDLKLRDRIRAERVHSQHYNDTNIQVFFRNHHTGLFESRVFVTCVSNNQFSRLAWYKLTKSSNTWHMLTQSPFMDSNERSLKTVSFHIDLHLYEHIDIAMLACVTYSNRNDPYGGLNTDLPVARFVNLPQLKERLNLLTNTSNAMRPCLAYDSGQFGLLDETDTLYGGAIYQKSTQLSSFEEDPMYHDCIGDCEICVITDNATNARNDFVRMRMKLPNLYGRTDYNYEFSRLTCECELCDTVVWTSGDMDITPRAITKRNEFTDTMVSILDVVVGSRYTCTVYSRKAMSGPISKIFYIDEIFDVDYNAMQFIDNSSAVLSATTDHSVSYDSNLGTLFGEYWFVLAALLIGLLAIFIVVLLAYERIVPYCNN